MVSSASSLPPHLRDFCRRYVELGGGPGAGPDAYLKAFPRCTSRNAARVNASRLLKRDDVRAEIDFVQNILQGRPQAARLIGTGGSPPLNGTVFPPGAPQPEPRRPMSDVERVNREFIVSTLMRNIAMCMGDEDVPVSRVTKAERRVEGDIIREEYEAVTVMVRERNATAANQALKLLDEQLDKLRDEGLVPRPGEDAGEGAESQRTIGRDVPPDQLEKLQQYREFLRGEEAAL